MVNKPIANSQQPSPSPLKRVIRVGRRALVSLSRRNYASAKAYGLLSLHWANLRQKQPLIIFQMGKVGSTTIARSLEAVGLKMSVFHVHVLSEEGLKRHEQIYRQSFSERRRIDRQLLASYYLRRRLEKGIKGQPWKIITLVRDPIARNLSSFFEILDLEYKHHGYHHRIQEGNGAVPSAAQLANTFLQEFPHETPLIWFDRELKGVFGIDVYAQPFPHAKGYELYRGDRVEVLLLRLEDLNRCTAPAFKEFLNLDQVDLVKVNVGQQKYYSKAYTEVLNSVKLPESYLDQMYSSRYATHFYSPDEVQRFRANWAVTEEAFKA
ncbi:MAG TPA: putative capsular polysaccharide synthesis family protein [Anaerolineae bacterium]|nr:putative capsular polysaccharide synthesis family protein [Anaerolineae bacterium]HMR62508.1 putative capsular polysaccharide synthesis family protein [Anaerolineae bacterium]